MPRAVADNSEVGCDPLARAAPGGREAARADVRSRNRLVRAERACTGRAAESEGEGEEEGEGDVDEGGDTDGKEEGEGEGDDGSGGPTGSGGTTSTPDPDGEGGPSGGTVRRQNFVALSWGVVTRGGGYTDAAPDGRGVGSYSGGDGGAGGSDPVLPLLLGVATSVATTCALVVWMIYVVAGAQPTGTLRASILTAVASTLLQLIVIGIVGAALRLLFNRFTQARADTRAKAAREAEHRSDVNALRKQLLGQLFEANRDVRRARHLIPAHLSLETYDEQMLVTLDAQFDLSDLAHEINAMNPELLFPKEVEATIKAMSEYLGRLTLEFQSESPKLRTQRQVDVSAAVAGGLKELPRLQAFIGPFDELKDGELKDGEFKKEYMNAYWLARNEMRTTILSASHLGDRPAT